MELVDLETGGAADFEPAALQALFSVVSVRRALLRVQARVRGIRARELVRGMRMQRTLDSREIQEAALTMLDMRHVSSGTVLFEQGALADDGMCMIVRGTCDATVDGRVVNTMEAGQYFGEMALLQHADARARGEARAGGRAAPAPTPTRSAGVAAATDCLLGCLPNDAFHALCEQCPSFAEMLRTPPRQYVYSSGAGGGAPARSSHSATAAGAAATEEEEEEAPHVNTQQFGAWLDNLGRMVVKTHVDTQQFGAGAAFSRARGRLRAGHGLVRAKKRGDGGGGGGSSSSSSSSSSRRHELLVAILMIACYLAFSYLYYGAGGEGGEKEAGTGKPWSKTDCIYFAITTITTVGYGDLAPRSDRAKLVTVLFVFFGFMGMGVALGRIVEYFIELEEVFRRRAAARLMAETERVQGRLAAAKSLATAVAAQGARGAGGQLKKAKSLKIPGKKALKGLHAATGATGAKALSLVRQASYKAVKANKHLAGNLRGAASKIGLDKGLGLAISGVSTTTALVRCLVPLLVYLALGLVMGHFEDWGALDSIYVAAITMSCVGFGDLSPQTQQGRTFAIFYVPFGIGVLMNTVGNLARLFVSSGRTHAESLPVTVLQEMDADGGGEITQVAFLRYMLRTMDKVDNETLDLLCAQFRAACKAQPGSPDVISLACLSEAGLEVPMLVDNVS